LGLLDTAILLDGEGLLVSVGVGSSSFACLGFELEDGEFGCTCSVQIKTYLLGSYTLILRLFYVIELFRADDLMD
jgi:hypothetical protein